ncbi:N-acetylneuraminate synthase [Methanococcoides vulcani]|uniref:N-acetylneuraminate synthase n=1 Tax=Methanococcoides vulcani TaxID=1353158 RepID=A0A1I0AQ27_9EURY|nr:N-acetylneuraminate synthase [Methanococcoides vulcani]SES96025.1 N-acetylneuraminate synthase [Methanococcoides vulcani]
MEKIKIGNRIIGNGTPCFIIAEAGVNHNGSLELAKKLIDVAVDAGVDAVKFQTFKADKLVVPDAEKADYQKNTAVEEDSQYQMLKKLELTEHEFMELSSYAREHDLIFLSSPFDKESADFLDSVSVPIFKISSGELTNIPLLKHIARKKKPIILSTGMATVGEIDEVLSTLAKEGSEGIILLHCVTNYPAKMEEVNLNVIKTLRCCYKLPVGFSDHTPGIVASLAATAMGSCVVEKHFTIDKNLPGPDHSASLNPTELKDLVQGIRDIENAMGDGRKKPTSAEQKIKKFVRKSIVASADVQTDTVITEYMLDIKRTGEDKGIEPKHWDYIIGSKTKVDLNKDQPIKWNMIE